MWDDAPNSPPKFRPPATPSHRQSMVRQTLNPGSYRSVENAWRAAPQVMPSFPPPSGFGGMVSGASGLMSQASNISGMAGMFSGRGRRGLLGGGGLSGISALLSAVGAANSFSDFGRPPGGGLLPQLQGATAALSGLGNIFGMGARRGGLPKVMGMLPQAQGALSSISGLMGPGGALGDNRQSGRPRCRWGRQIALRAPKPASGAFPVGFPPPQPPQAPLGPVSATAAAALPQSAYPRRKTAVRWRPTKRNRALEAGQGPPAMPSGALPIPATVGVMPAMAAAVGMMGG